jgi:hypothetical protein
MIRIYTREGPPHGYYDTNSLGLEQAKSILRADGVYHIEVIAPADRAGETIIPAREVIRVKPVEGE